MKYQKSLFYGQIVLYYKSCDESYNYDNAVIPKILPIPILELNGVPIAILEINEVLIQMLEF